MSRRRKEYLGKQREVALSRLQSHLIWMPMMPPCGVQAETEQAFLRVRSRGVGDQERSQGRAYLDGHVLEAVSCILHYFAEAKDGAERVCDSIVNARFEVGCGDVWKNIPPKVGRKQKREARKISARSRNCVQDLGELARLATTYLLKLNLGYQMLFLTKRVKFSAAFKQAGLKKKLSCVDYNTVIVTVSTNISTLTYLCNIFRKHIHVSYNVILSKK